MSGKGLKLEYIFIVVQKPATVTTRLRVLVSTTLFFQIIISIMILHNNNKKKREELALLNTASVWLLSTEITNDLGENFTIPSRYAGNIGSSNDSTISAIYQRLLYIFKLLVILLLNRITMFACKENIVLHQSVRLWKRVGHLQINTLLVFECRTFCHTRTFEVCCMFWLLSS